MSEIASFMIMFRESLEAALVVGIILAYLRKTGGTRYTNLVYVGIAAGVVASIIAAVLFNALAGGFTGAAEQLFEGVSMIAGAGLITFMIIWLMQQKHMASELEGKVRRELRESHKFGIFFLTFVSVLREGVETVIFLGAASFLGGGYSLVGSIGGIIAAIALGYLIFAEMMRIDLKKVFLATGIILLLFAAGLASRGAHELQEAGIVPGIVEHIWDINPPLNADGSFPLLHEEGAIGTVAVSLFGYSGSPSLTDVIAYLAYMALMALLLLVIRRRADEPRPWGRPTSSAQGKRE